MGGRRKFDAFLTLPYSLVSKYLVFKIYPSFCIVMYVLQGQGTSLDSLGVYLDNTKFYRHLLARYDFGCQSFKISSFLMKQSEIGCLNSQVYLLLCFYSTCAI